MPPVFRGHFSLKSCENMLTFSYIVVKYLTICKDYAEIKQADLS